MVYTSLDYAYGQRTWEAVWSVEILLIGGLLSIFAVHPLGRLVVAPTMVVLSQGRQTPSTIGELS